MVIWKFLHFTVKKRHKDTRMSFLNLHHVTRFNSFQSFSWCSFCLVFVCIQSWQREMQLSQSLSNLKCAIFKVFMKTRKIFITGENICFFMLWVAIITAFLIKANVGSIQLKRFPFRCNWISVIFLFEGLQKGIV